MPEQQLQFTQNDLEDFLIAYGVYFYRAAQDHREKPNSGWSKEKIHHMSEVVDFLRSLRGQGDISITAKGNHGEPPTNTGTDRNSAQVL